MSALSSTSVPKDFGLISDMGVLELSSVTQTWTGGASTEYDAIGDKLVYAANNYSTAEDFGSSQAKEVGK